MIRQLSSILMLIILGSVTVLHGIVFIMGLMMLHTTEPLELLWMIVALLAMLFVLRWRES